MSKAGKKTSSNRSQKRARRALMLLAVIAVCLAAVLLILPSDKEAADAEIAQSAERTQPAEPMPEYSEPGTVQHPQAQPTETVEAGRLERPLPKIRVAVVIDDVGYSLEQLQVFLDFSEPITLSVLPNLQYSRESAKRVHAAGKELILHLPMEALNGEDPGPGAIRTSQSRKEIRGLLESSFSQVPHAVGMNNHMGSRATANERVMTVIMGYLQTGGYFFLDSRTTTDTVGAGTAETYAVPYLERDVFLDNEAGTEEIEKALDQGIELARTKGHAVLIGHVRNPQIVEVIGQHLAELQRSGVELVSLSALLEETGGDS